MNSLVMTPLRIRIMCPINPSKPVGLVQNERHHHLIEMYLVFTMM